MALQRQRHEDMREREKESSERQRRMLRERAQETNKEKRGPDQTSRASSALQKS